MLVKLKDLLLIKNGSDYKHLPAGDIPVIGTGGVMLYVNKFLYDKEAILLPRKGSLNNIMYINKPFWTVDTMFYAIPNSKIVNAIFLYYRLKLFDFTKYDVGSTIPSMTASLYYSLSIDLPPLEIQNKIASILSSIDVQIERNSFMVKKLQVLTQGIFNNFYGRKIYSFNASMSEVCKFPSGYAFEPSYYRIDGNYQLVTIKNVNGIFVDNQKIDCLSKLPPKMKLFCYLKVGDILLSLTGNVGRISINTLNNALLNQRVAKFVCDEKYKAYLYILLNTNYYQEKLKQMASGTSQKNLSPNGIENLKIYVPDNINDFNMTTNEIFSQLCKINLLTSKLQEIKNKLLPLLINQQLS